MNLSKIFKKLKKLRFQQINGKSAALFLLNRKLPALAGGNTNIDKITDLRLDRQRKAISFELTGNGNTSTLTIRDYHFTARKGQSQLAWSAMDFDGPGAENYRKAFSGISHIEVPKRYISIMEAAL